MHHWAIIVALLYVFTGRSAWAETIVVQPHDDSKIKLNNQLSVWKDDTGLLPLEAIREKFARNEMETSKVESLNLGFTQASYWFAFQLKFAAHPIMPWYLALEWPNMDVIDVSIFQGNRQLRFYESGDLRPFANRSLAERYFYFEIPTENQEELTVFVRTKTDGAMNVPLYLQSLKSVSNGNHNFQLFLGLFFGSIVIMALYFLIIGIFARNLENIYLALFFICVGVFRLTYHGLTFEYLLPFSPRFVNTLVPLSVAFLFLFLSLFSRRFLELQFYPKLSAISNGLVIVWGLLPIAAYVWGYRLMLGLMLFGVTSCVYWIAMALYRWRRGLQSALALAFALSYPAWGAIAAGFIFIGIFPGSEFTIYATETSIGLFILLLALSASNKINESNTRVKLAQEELIKAQIHSRDATEKLNFGLEKLVEEKTRRIRSILNSIELGIFTISKETFTIDAEYSPYMATIFGEEAMSQLSPLNLLFSDESSVDLRDRTDSSIKLILGEDLINFQVNRANLIDEVTFVSNNREKRILSIDWNPIIADSVVDKLLVTIKDVTDMRNMHTKMHEHQEDLEIVGEIIALDEKDFSIFLRNAFKLLSKTEHLVRGLQAFQPRVWHEILIHLHTIKGEARTLGLSALTNIIHLVESSWIGALEKPQSDWDQSHALGRIQEISFVMDRYVKISHNLLRRSNLQEFSDGPAELKGELRNIHRLMKSTAESLGKELPHFDLQHSRPVYLSPDGQAMIRGIFVHMFRNCIDHGIETPREREAAGKSTKGTIFCKISETGADLELNWSDDGKGLDIAKLRKIAQESARMIDSDEDLAALIFEPGVSTKDEVSDVSGRGVGMQAVLASIEGHGGKIKIHFTSDPDSRGFRSFAFRINWPHKSSLFIDAQDAA